jgi:hypothetical protein
MLLFVAAHIFPMGRADHSLPCGAEVKMRGAIHPPQYMFMAWCIVKHRDFTFTFTYLLTSSMAQNII